ncbi:MAG TPA: ABC transporter permease [Chitinophagaceae bacterium]|nr:ABC transporter permease [Chitinophagaceae bacterium]
MPGIPIIDNNNWTEVITPRKKLLDIKLREVWHYRDLVLLFVKRDMAAQYKQTVLGPVWYVIQPIFTTIVFFFVFNKVAGIDTKPVPPPVFYMSSITIWNYFSTCFTATSGVFVANASIFGKVYFPRLVLPISVIISNMVKFGIQLCLLVIVILYFLFIDKNSYPYFSYHFGPHLLLLPVIILAMAGLGLGGGIIISSVTTKYRDFTVLVTFGMQLMMYISPVPYPFKYVALKHPQYQTLLLSNPLSSLIEGFRYAILGEGTISVGWFIYSCAFTLFTLFIGILIFSKVERTFMDTV